MNLNKDFFKSLLSSNDSALDFYLSYATVGLFYFNRDNINDVWVDAKLLHFLGVKEASSSYQIRQFLEDKSIKQVEEWLNEEAILEVEKKLYCKIKNDRYEIACRKFIDANKNIVFIGIAEFTKINKTNGEEYFNYIVENATEGITVYENEVLVYASPSYLSMMGDELDEIKGKGAEWAFGIIHPEDRPKIFQIFEEIYAKRIPQKRYRFRAKKKDGTYIWREDHASFVFTENNGIERSVVVAKDITYQIDMEKELVKQEEIYRKLFNNVQIGLLITDYETEIQEINEVACSIIGLPKEVLLGSKINDPNWILFDENFKNYTLEEFPVCITAATGNSVAPLKMGFYKHNNPDEVKWVEISSSPIVNENEEVEKIVSTFLDVTDKHKAQHEILTTNEDLTLFKQFIDSGTDGLQVMDKSGRVVFLNNIASERLAIRKEELYTFKVTDFESILETQDDWDAHFNELREKGKMSMEGEHTNLLTGRKFPVEITVKYAKLNNKEYAIASTRDITDRKKAEREIISQARFPKENPNPILRVNSKGKLLYLNDAAYSQLTSWKLELYQPVTLEIRALVKEVFAKKESLSFEAMIRGAVYSISITFIEDHKYANIYLLDITNQREAEEQLQLEKSRLDNIINGVKLGTWEWYMNENYLDFNIHWAEMLGYSLEEVKPGTYELWREKVHPDDLKNAEDAIQAHIKAETENYVAEFRMKHKEGHWVWIVSRGKIISKDGFDKPILFSGTHNDITERKRQEEELKLFESVIKNTKDAVMISEVNEEYPLASRITFVNESFCEMTGYLPSDLLGYSPEMMHGPLTDKNVVKKILMHSKNWEPFEFELINYRKNGNPYWINLSVSPLNGIEGENKYWISILRDVTTRKKQEEELRLFESIIKKANDSVLITETERIEKKGLKIIFANEAFCKMTGYSQEELLEETTDILRGPLTDINTIEKIEKSIQSLKPFEYELINYRKNGESFWLNLSATPLVNEKGEYTHWITIQRDITQQKEQEEELRLFESIIKNTKDAVLISEICNKDPLESEIVFANEALCEMTGYTTKELYGKSPEVLRGPLTDEDTLKKISKATINVEAFEFELINYKKDGEPFWLSLSVTPLKDIKGKLTHWITIQRDITEQKVQDQKLREAKEKAVAASVAKSDFLANMSHEIRTPLNSVIGFSELLMQTKLSNAQLEYMQSVNYSAHSLLDLINDILDFSKIEAGKLELNIERIDIHELLYQVIEMVKFKISSQQIELILFIDNNVPQFVWVDAVRLRQILVNLLSNASKFTENGEIELSVERDKNLIDNSVVKLQLGVRDTGIGISKNKQKTIFDAFAQEDASTTRKYGGTGLGLSITNKLLALMGSSMQLKSKQGKGSRFYFNIELKTDNHVDADGITKKLVQNTISKVLVVDDNARTLSIIQGMLQEMGLEVSVCSNGIEALTIIQNLGKQLDVVFLDCEMPFMTGIDIVKQIRGQLELGAEDLPIFLMSNFANDDKYLKELKTYKISKLVHKPLFFKDLFDSIESITNQDYKEVIVNNDELKHTQNLNGNTVLVVDDNPINRKLVLSMLDKLFIDLEVVEADSGKEAVKIVQKLNPNLILMDIQMPGMSGYEATQAIRKLQNESTMFEATTPAILALTAGTVKGERERCIAAGMDDYLSKPITMDKLEEAIQTWIGLKKKTTTMVVEDKSHKRNVDLNYSELLRRFSNDKVVIEEMLNMIRRGDLKSYIIKLSLLLKSKTKDNDQIKSTAHSIKGVGLNLCFEKLAETANRLENMYPNYKNIEVQGLIEVLLNDYNSLESIIFNSEYTNVNV